MKKPLELYIHIPFCLRKCAYCDFLSNVQNEETIETYVLSLVDEILAHGSERKYVSDYEVTTIFFGGGTPGMVDVAYISGIMNTVRECFDNP